MYRLSDWRRGATLVAMAGCCLAAPAQPQGEGEGLGEAQWHLEQGHAARAAVVLLRLSEAGQVAAMERLALMHWYGPVLYPGGPWKRELAVLWFARAAEHGSEVGSHMLAHSQRGSAGTAQATGR